MLATSPTEIVNAIVDSVLQEQALVEFFQPLQSKKCNGLGGVWRAPTNIGLPCTAGRAGLLHSAAGLGMKRGIVAAATASCGPRATPHSQWNTSGMKTFSLY
jgi:hypothetical protein